MSAFRAITILSIAIAALLFAGCGKDTHNSVGNTASNNVSEDKAETASSEKAPRRKVVRRTHLQPIEENRKYSPRILAGPFRRQVFYQNDRGDYLYLNGEKLDEFGYSAAPCFSPDGKRYAYLAFPEKDEDVCYVVIDGLPSPICYDALSVAPVFSPDSKRVAFAAYFGENHEFVVVDGKDGKLYRRIYENSIQFSPDSKRLVYLAETSEGELLLFDNDVEQPIDICCFGHPYISFSPDGSRMAHRTDEEDQIVIDGELQKRYYEVFRPVFGPEGKNIAYAAYGYTEDTKEMFIVLNGHEQERFPGIYGFSESMKYPVFSRNGEKLAYAVNCADGDIVIVDGVKSKTFSRISEVGFIGEDNRLMCVVWEGNTASILVEWEEVFSYGDCGELLPFYDQEVQRFAAVVVEDKRHSLAIIDGVEGGVYDRIRNPGFSPDGKHFSYVAQVGDKEFVVVDTCEGEPFDSILTNKLSKWYPFDDVSIIWDSPTTFHYLARDGDKIYLVEEVIIEEPK